MWCIFLIFLISVGSESFDPEPTSDLDYHGGGLHWDGISGIILRQMFAPKSQSSYSSNTGYQYQSQPQIYGNTGYTTGQINAIQTVHTGQYANYNGYANNYWICVNTYRGQYYYSYTFGHYVCDTRANRNGK